jgi:hypothetical protein
LCRWGKETGLKKRERTCIAEDGGVLRSAAAIMWQVHLLGLYWRPHLLVGAGFLANICKNTTEPKEVLSLLRGPPTIGIWGDQADTGKGVVKQEGWLSQTSEWTTSLAEMFTG